MIGDRDVNDIQARRHRHVTRNATVVVALDQAFRQREGAAPSLMAIQALLTVVRGFFRH